MSDNLLDTDQYGKASVEAGQGYQAMPDPRPAEADNAERANAERTIDRLNTLPEPGSAMGEPLPVHYHEPGDPNKTSDPKLTLEAERAAKDLADWRRGQEEIDRTLKDLELAAEIDTLKAAQPQSQQPQAPAEPVALDQQQQQQEPVPPGFDAADSDLVRAFRENPKLLEAMNAYSWQTDERIRVAEQQAQARTAQVEAAAADFIHANARNAIAGIFVRHPALQGLSIDQLPTALAMLQRTNPQEHAAVMNEVAGIQGLLNESNRVARVQQEHSTQQFRQQFYTWSGEEDSKFTKAHPEMADSATAANVTQRTRAYVHQKGFSDDDIARAWNGQASLYLRDARVQSMLYDAMRYREAVAAVPAARANKPVKVQVPGPTGQRASEQDYDMRALSNRLSETKNIKDAAALLAARRAKSR